MRAILPKNRNVANICMILEILKGAAWSLFLYLNCLKAEYNDE